MKRMFAPSHWCLDKLRGVYATRPSTGPHKLRECIPVTVLLRNRLKYALSGQEAMKICRDKSGNRPGSDQGAIRKNDMILVAVERPTQEGATALCLI